MGIWTKFQTTCTLWIYATALTKYLAWNVIVGEGVKIQTIACMHCKYKDFEQ